MRLPRVVRLQEAAPRFLAEKLRRFYVHPAPERAWVAELAELLRAEDLVLEPVLRRLFTSRLFFSPAVRRSLVKSPVEYSIGALRTLEARLGATQVAGLLQGEAVGRIVQKSAWFCRNTL